MYTLNKNQIFLSLHFFFILWKKYIFMRSFVFEVKTHYSCYSKSQLLFFEIIFMHIYKKHTRKIN